MSGPDFDRMTKDQVIAWFTTAEDISPVVSSMSPATESISRPETGIPMMLASIRLPVILVEQLDRLAELLGVRRSELIRDALASYIKEKTTPVGRDEAEHALDVLRRAISGQNRAA